MFTFQLTYLCAQTSTYVGVKGEHKNNIRSIPYRFWRHQS